MALDFAKKYAHGMVGHCLLQFCPPINPSNVGGNSHCCCFFHAFPTFQSWILALKNPSAHQSNKPRLGQDEDEASAGEPEQTEEPEEPEDSEEPEEPEEPEDPEEDEDEDEDCVDLRWVVQQIVINSFSLTYITYRTYTGSRGSFQRCGY